MGGRLLFWLVVVLVICLLVADIECKKKKKGKKSKEKSSRRSRGSRESRDSSVSDEWTGYRGNRWNPDRQGRWPNRWSGGNSQDRDIFQGPRGGPGQGHVIIYNRNRPWWQQTTTQGPPTTTLSPWQQRQRWWVRPGGNGWRNGEESSDSDQTWSDSSLDEWEDWRRWGAWRDWEDADSWEDSWESSESSKSRNSKHSHGSKKSKHSHGSRNSKHSRGSRRSSESSEDSSSDDSSDGYQYIIIDGGDADGVDPIWCRNWCLNFARHNFYTLFPYAGTWGRSLNVNSYIQAYCERFMDQYGHYCNSTEGVTTVDPQETTTPINRNYECSSSADCWSDECCVAVGGDRRNRTCMKLSGRNDRCSLPEQTVWYQDFQIYADSCPCEYGYECMTKLDFLLSKRPSLSRLVSPDSQDSLESERKCKPGRNMTAVTTTDAPIVTILPPIETTSPDSSSEVENTTAPPRRPCTSHMDCDFFQCCVYDDDDTPEVGVCDNFSKRGDLCSLVTDLSEFSIVDHCPCQSFLRCKSYARGFDDIVYHRCG